MNFVVEAVGAGEGGGLVVASQEDEAVRVQAFEDKEVADGLDGVVTSINIVTEEYTVAVCGNQLGAGLLTYCSICRKSQNWPWMSPMTCWGHRSSIRLGSWMRMAIAQSASVLTSFSVSSCDCSSFALSFCIRFEQLAKDVLNQYNCSCITMSLASVAYREVEAIVQTWTKKYQYHISLAETKPNQVKFMVEFSLPQPQQPVPVTTIRVYFTCSSHDTPLTITFRFQKDSLIHSPQKTIRQGEIEKWIDDAMSKKLLVRETVFYLGTAYESTRLRSERQDRIMREQVKPVEEEFVFIHPDLLADQKRIIEVMEKPKSHAQAVQAKLKQFFKQVDKDDVGVITHQELLALTQNIGVKLTPLEQKELLKKADPTETGMVEYDCYQQVAREFFEGLLSKEEADQKLQSNYEEEVFSSILALINDESQDIQDFIVERLRQKDEDETGLTNVSEVKTVLDEVTKKYKEEGKCEPLTVSELADVIKLITDAYGYKEIPYAQIHGHIIQYKIRQLSQGRVNSRINNLEAHLQELFAPFDEKKNGRIRLEALQQAIRRSSKIKLTVSQMYLLKSLLAVDVKGEVSYTDNLKFLAELIKRLYLNSSKKRQ